MASRADLELARRLLAASALTQDQIREGLELQADLLQKGKVASLERVLVAKGHLPADAAVYLNAGDPVVTQPFARYRCLRLAGKGGSSGVYEATYLPNGARVALKAMDPVQALRKEHVERFQEEARLLIQLDHENIVAGYELGYASGYHFYTMDYIEGPTVLEMIDRAGALPAATATWVALQTAKALSYLHAEGLLHRDIKPGNVMIDATGRARLIDLGLVRRLAAAPVGGAADEETTVGTVEYIAPEQARGRGDIDVRADIYSLGVSLYHMVVGDVPFTGDSSYEVMAKHILSGLETQKVKNRRIPPEVHYAITKMMSKDREQRYADMGEVATELASFLPPGGPPPIVLPVATPPAEAPSRPHVSPPVPPRRPTSSSELRRRPRR
jgi:serine/threonine-protein kinase